MDIDKIKGLLIYWYYHLIFWLEENMPDFPAMLNKHRNKLDDKYWNRYIWLHVQRRIEDGARREKSRAK